MISIYLIKRISSQENSKTSKSSFKYETEKFWIDMYIVEEENNPFNLLTSFFIRLLIIPHSTCSIERQFSQMAMIKN